MTMVILGPTIYISWYVYKLVGDDADVFQPTVSQQMQVQYLAKKRHTATAANGQYLAHILSLQPLLLYSFQVGRSIFGVYQNISGKAVNT